MSVNFANRAGTILAALTLAILMAMAPAGSAAAQVKVTSVTVTGNQRIPAATILTYAGIKSGDAVTAGEIDDAAQRVLASGLFETVDMTPRGSGLVIAVQERPTINRISIEGNRRLKDEDLMKAIASQPQHVYSPSVAEADAAAIADAYTSAARISAKVTPRIIRRSENRVDLVFEVAESRVVENERVAFVGNRAFSDYRLRRVIRTKQAGLLRALIQSDTYVPQRTDLDRQLLTDFYTSRGYADFQVLDVSAVYSRERDATFLTFTVHEGQPFTIGRIDVTSEFPGLDVAQYRRALRIRTGQTWNPAAIDEQVSRLERLGLQQGYDFLRAEPKVTRNPRTLTLDVTFALVHGPRVFVQRIDIKGNATTLDRVVRRQFDTVEGDPFNPRAIRDAADRIRALGFFKSADVQTRQGSAPDQVIVDVNVEEQPTGSLTLGGSYSSDSGIGLSIGFSERNFLGRGQALTLDLQNGAQNNSSRFSFTEPAFLSRDLSLGIALASEATNYSNTAYQTRVTSFSPSLAFPVSENARLKIYYEFAKESIFDVSSDASPILLSEAGSKFRSSVGYEYRWDLLHGGLNPRQGTILTFGQDFAGLGGDVKYVRSRVRALAQRDIWNDEVTVRAIFEGGIVTSIGGGGTRVTDRFFLGSGQLRGFTARGVGPRDTGAVQADVLGGNRYMSLRFEADFPLGLPEEYGIKGGVFMDNASLWGLDNTSGIATVNDGFELRSSVGVSIFWTTPIGPLRLNFAKAIRSNPLDEKSVFDFAISTAF